MSKHRPLGATGLDCHPLGFGCYRVVDQNPEHEASLRAYLERGGNLIDTSANYGDGHSEALVGRVLEDVGRDGIVLVTKGGYIQGGNMVLAQERSFPEVVEYGEGIWHCIHPEFLETQVERSCARLRTDHIDVFLLHNPEYYLEDRSHKGGVTAADHEEFYRRIRLAFEYLESQVEAGRISWYGISSNNFGRPAFPPDRPTTMTSVSRCLTEAVSLTSDHHFRVVQLPLNLMEPGGALTANNEDRTALEFCAANGIGVLANRPLNAFRDGQILRLADWVAPGSEHPGPEALHAILQPLQEREEELARTLGERLPLEATTAMAKWVEGAASQAVNQAAWEQVFAPQLLRPLGTWIAGCRDKYQGNEDWEAWEAGFLQTLNTVLEYLGRFLMSGRQKDSDEVRRRLVDAGYPEGRQSLSRMALNVLASLEGLSCTLVGMRRTAWVEDAMAVPGLEPVDGRAILEKFSGD